MKNHSSALRDVHVLQMYTEKELEAKVQGPKLHLPCRLLLRAGDQTGRPLAIDYCICFFDLLMYSEKLIKNKIHSCLPTIYSLFVLVMFLK